MLQSDNATEPYAHRPPDIVEHLHALGDIFRREHAELELRLPIGSTATMAAWPTRWVLAAAEPAQVDGLLWFHHCTDRKAPKRAVKCPARPCKNGIQNRFPENANAA